MLTFTPAPLENGSGREVWPQIRDGSRDTLHDLRDHVRELLRRK